MGLLRFQCTVVIASLVVACGGSGSGSGSAGGSGGGNADPSPATPPNSSGRIMQISPGPGATEAAQLAFIQAGPGDSIAFDCGFFALDTGLVLNNTEGVTIRGCGINQTVLSFAASDQAVGLLISNVRGITVTDLTVADTPGDGIKIKSSDFVTYRKVRTMWSSADQPVTADNYAKVIDSYNCPAVGEGFTYQPSPSNGRYGIYPVQSTNVLLDEVESLGASDAGIYVGQSDDVIVKNSHALYNVAGFELENTQRAEMFGNTAECNAVGYIIYDLNNLTQYGTLGRMHDNLARNNNFENFAAGGFVSQVPPGSGLITLAYDRVEVFDNTFKDHQTAGIIITSYELLGGNGDQRQDIYTEALHIHDNRFVNSGYNPPLPSLAQLQAALTGGDPSGLLPALIRVKNFGFGADILWDGLYDEPSACPKPQGAAVDSRGKPVYEGTSADPQCRYNAYKFDANGQRKKPQMWICIENNSSTGSPLAPEFANFHGLEGVEGLLIELAGNPQQGLQDLLTDPLGTVVALVGSVPKTFADRDISPHQCLQQYGATLPGVAPVALAEYTPSPGAEPPPSDEEVAALCGRDTNGAVNWAALAAVNCPRLSDYQLFSNPEDPTANANGGTPYDLNTILFSDYAVKHRFVFMPAGTAAAWRDASDGATATWVFPVGTAISKTFSFPEERGAKVNHVETRLLLKREDGDGTPYWVGLPYIWEQDANGEPVARLSLLGGEASASWHYFDANTGALHQGSTDSYSIPSTNECASCHADTHRTAGPAPIGPKPRNMNKPYPYASGKMNQLAYWVQNGLVRGAPALGVDPNTMVAESVLRLPRFEVPGDAGFPAGSGPDIEARVRAYLETNCAHCHNPGGGASNTGLYLDSLRQVDGQYGICKQPTAAGQGTGGRPYDIVPGNAAQSILPFRMGNAGEPEIQMPPLARSVNHDEAKELVERWINQVVDSSYQNAGACQ